MIAALFLAIAFQAQQPVRVQASLTDPEIRVGETTTLRVEVETDGARAQIQRFTTLPTGLELAGSRDWDQRQFSLPGGTRRHVSRDFVLRAHEPGRYRIPAVDVLVDGRAYTTESLLLTVGGSGARPDGGPGAADGVILRAWVDADTVYVGQQVTLHVEAMFSPDARLRLRRAPEYEAPSPAGFWTHDIPGARPPTTRGTRGDVYEVQTFRRAFFPISPGRFEIPPARLFYEMRRGILSAPETFTVASDPLPVVVLPVPEEGRSVDFTGAVGRFTARGALEPTHVAAGDATVLSIEVEGVGNVKALPPPQLPELPGVQVFPPSEASDVTLDGAVVKGRKRFSWVLIPQEAGQRPLPEIRYVFFDPGTARFDTATIAPVQLLVGPGAVVGNAPPASALRYLKTAPGGGSRLAWVRSPWFAAAQIAPLLLLAAVMVRRARPGTGAHLSLATLRRRRRAALRELEERAEAGAAGVAGEAETEVRAWLGARLGIDPREATDARALATAGVSPETTSAVRRVLDSLATARFAPTPPGPAALRDLIRAAEAVLERVDREAPKPRARASRSPERAAAAALTVAAIGFATFAASATPTQPAPGDTPGDAFTQGLAFFDDSRYEEAASAFERHVRVARGDAAAWYNYGTALYRAGESGRAVWAWLNAVRLAPRDPEPRHNLRLAGAPPELMDRMTPWLPLHLDELLLLASIAWFIAGVGAAWWAMRRRTSALAVAALATLAALGLVTTAWTATRSPDTLVLFQQAPLRAGPNLNAEPLVDLAPGTGLMTVARQGDWVRARTFEGREGWLENAVVGRIPDS